MDVCIKNICKYPLSEGTRTGRHIYLAPGKAGGVPKELAEKWCARGLAKRVAVYASAHLGPLPEESAHGEKKESEAHNDG